MRTKKEVLTPRDVAEVTGKSVRLIYRQLRKGNIPNVKCGDRYLIERRAFYRWLSGQANKSVNN